ncbi:hypothetical protein [Candidatus Poriferisodalis sp.]|uniref:hypothetical protein n=1 Tax=Candidatus Poriferisodalis sp. TaxID=3101277 RepID=UPI003B524093
MVSLPGSDAPHGLAAVDGSGTVSTVTATLNDGEAFLAVLIIDDADDPTEFRFQGAVPSGHTAEVQSNGSVTIYDASVNPAGGWAAPWAQDAEGASVSTSFAVEGTTLVQTINHIGHAYPVIADPCGSWAQFIACAAVVVAVIAAISACGSGVGAPACGLVIAAAVVAVGTATVAHIEPTPSPQPSQPSTPETRPRSQPSCSRPGCR